MRESANASSRELADAASPRILHVTEALGGGIHSAIASWAAATPDLNHLVLARARTGQATYAWPDNVKASLHETSLVGLYRESVRREKAYTPHAIHLHSSKAGVFRAGRYRTGRIVYSPHCFAFQRQDIGPLMKSIYRSIEGLLAPRSVIASVSSEEKEQAESLREGVRTVLVPNYSQLEPQPLHVTSRTIVTVGRILPQKDPRFFIETVRRLRSNYEIVWIGDGDPVLRNELVSLGIHVTGWLPMDDLVQEVSRAGLYLHTASWEGSPLATLEAINAGTAVLSRDIPSMRSVGYEVPSDTPQGLAAAIEKYFSDPSYRKTVFDTCGRIQTANSQSVAAKTLLAAYSIKAAQPQETT